MLAYDMNKTADDQATEQRSHQRVELVVDVTLHGEHNFFMGCTHNISAGGVFVATHEVYEIGTQVFLTLTLPEATRAIQVTGNVRWVRPYKEDNDAHAGVGVQFSNLQAEDAASIEAFIAHRPPIFYE